MTEVSKNQFHLTNFEGPLDLLLFLIKRNEVSIYDIPIAEITAQYLEFLRTDAMPDVDEASNFYLMAATLIYIKSRVLLPIEINVADELDDPRQELVDRLIEYQKYKKLTELMKRPNDEWIVERSDAQRNLPFPKDEEIWKELDVWELLGTFTTLVGGLVPEKILDLYEEVSINEKVTLIHEKLQSKNEFPFTEIILQPHSVIDVICSFLALLELVKSKVISIYQHKLFGDIIIKARRQAAEEAEAADKTSETEDHINDGTIAN